MSQENGLFARNDEQQAAADDQVQVDMDKYLVVSSAGVLYGVKTQYINTILTEISITWLPVLPQHIRGVINLRGAVVPILDFRLLLGQEAGEKSCTIVLEKDGTQIGIMVDEVDQTIDIETSRILPVPYQSGLEAQKMVTGMYSLPGQNRTLMVLDCTVLLNGHQ